MLRGTTPPSESAPRPGDSLSHFRILEQVGVGGMGVVYRATDERLEREVALKLLPPGALSSGGDRTSCRGEARTLSRLNHPAIATLYDVGEEGDQDYLVMEFVEGETLEMKLVNGPLPEPEIAAIGEQIAAALQAAHEEHVVHCDLKPGNVMVTPRGQVKVLDFGIARLMRSRDAARGALPTENGPQAGTLPYMSPEQLLEGRLDTRTDLYSLGVVLYHMAAGRVPFENGVALVLANQIINNPPPPPSRFRADLSPRLEEIILKCMEKLPAERYQTAADVAVDLRRVSAPQARAAVRAGERAEARPIESLAVLPLENLSRDPEQEFFADGMTESLIAHLAQIAALRVISRTTAMQYKGARGALPEIARALNVDAIVEGAVFRAGDRVRITVQLVDAAKDQNLWAQSYERDVGDVLTLQGEVARAIAGEIKVKLTPREQERLGGTRAVNPRAYEAYLRGRHCWNKRVNSEVRRAVDYFHQAIEADPTYPAAYAGLADAYNILADIGTVAPLEAAARARAATSRALDLDPRLAEAHTSRAFIRFFFDWDWEGSERSFREAIAQNPNYATAHQWYAELLMSQGRFEEAITEGRKAEELDPLAFVIATSVADVLYFWRRYDDAIAKLRRVIEMEPTFAPARNDLARSLVQAGRPDEGIEEFLAAAELSEGDPRSHAGLGHAYAVAGRESDARAVLDVLTERARRLTVSSHAIAVIHTALGEFREAFDWMDRACREHDRAMVWLKVHPKLDALRADSRFQDLLKRVGFLA
jgi:eukaryotic-like serine/threonine-protein kinase